MDHARHSDLPDIGETETADIVRSRWVFRHPAVIRVCHWLNALFLGVLLMSGLQIFNAHPALYWGQVSTFDKPLASLDADTDANPPKGFLRLGGHRFDTTGVLGVSADAAGEPAERGFPRWATLPADQDLATGRRWHFFFAWLFVVNGSIYLAYGLVSGQFRARYIPSVDQLRDIGGSIKEHLLLRFPEGEEAKRYNVIQKITYFIVVVILLPVQILAGLAMSPGMDSVTPWLLELFGGRQSARTVHFVAASLLVLFVLVHVALVVLSGPLNNLRGMLTGWFAIARKPRPVPDHA